MPQETKSLISGMEKNRSTKTSVGMDACCSAFAVSRTFAIDLQIMAISPKACPFSKT